MLLVRYNVLLQWRSCEGNTMQGIVGSRPCDLGGGTGVEGRVGDVREVARCVYMEGGGIKGMRGILPSTQDEG